ncbi:MAG: hypothetical protein ACTSV3_08370 [Candidatus Thorarchaeota archaeon]
MTAIEDLRKAGILDSDGIIQIGNERICSCKPNHLNCMTAKSWLKAQIGVWEFYYEARDVKGQEEAPCHLSNRLGCKSH